MRGKKPSTVKAVDLFNSEEPRDKLFVRAWAASGVDPEMADLVMHVLGELRAAEARIEHLELAALDQSSAADQVALPMLEAPRLVDTDDDQKRNRLFDDLRAEQAEAIGRRLLPTTLRVVNDE